MKSIDSGYLPYMGKASAYETEVLRGIQAAKAHTLIRKRNAYGVYALEGTFVPPQRLSWCGSAGRAENICRFAAKVGSKWEDVTSQVASYQGEDSGSNYAYSSPPIRIPSETMEIPPEWEMFMEVEYETSMMREARTIITLFVKE